MWKLSRESVRFKRLFSSFKSIPFARDWPSIDPGTLSESVSFVFKVEELVPAEDEFVEAICLPGKKQKLLLAVENSKPIKNIS